MYLWGVGAAGEGQRHGWGAREGGVSWASSVRHCYVSLPPGWLVGHRCWAHRWLPPPMRVRLAGSGVRVLRVLRCCGAAVLTHLVSSSHSVQLV